MSTDIWEPLDNFDTSELDLPEDSFRCDGECSQTIKCPFYNLRVDGQDTLQFCTSCFEDAGRHLQKIIDEAEVIDRVNKTIEEKPLIWPCICCGKMLGGGYKWRIIETGRFGSTVLDICEDCNGEKLKNKFRLLKDVLVVERSEPIFISVEQVKRSIPEELKDQVTADRVSQWVSGIDCIVSIPEDFGSVKQWTLFTDFYDIPHYHASTALLIDCIDGPTNGRVASTVADDHGRGAINIVFNSIGEYLEEYNKWLSNRDVEKSNLLKETVEKDFDTKYSCDDDDLAGACDEFSGYIRTKNKLSLYYG